jgi:transcriptional regulator with XRE-family HTH domain
MISNRQIKAARALLGWSQEDLASKSGVSRPTIASVESSEGAADAPQKIVGALEAGGVEFLAEEDDGAGVRLKKAKPEPIDGEDLNASNDE